MKISTGILLAASSGMMSVVWIVNSSTKPLQCSKFRTVSILSFRARFEILHHRWWRTLLKLALKESLRLPSWVIPSDKGPPIRNSKIQRCKAPLSKVFFAKIWSIPPRNSLLQKALKSFATRMVTLFSCRLSQERWAIDSSICWGEGPLTVSWLPIRRHQIHTYFLGQRVQSTNSTEIEFCSLSTQSVNQLSIFVDIANFLRRFDTSTNSPLNNFDICLRAIHYMTKPFTLTVVIRDLRKKTIFFQKPKFCTFREILIFQSHSTDGKRSNSKLNTGVKLDIIKWQNVKKTFNFRFGWAIYLPFLHMGGKINKSRRVQKSRWATLEW